MTSILPFQSKLVSTLGCLLRRVIRASNHSHCAGNFSRLGFCLYFLTNCLLYALGTVDIQDTKLYSGKRTKQSHSADVPSTATRSSGRKTPCHTTGKVCYMIRRSLINVSFIQYYLTISALVTDSQRSGPQYA